MTDRPPILVTGGAGFIGSNLVRFLIREEKVQVLNVDALTYAGNFASVADLTPEEGHVFFQLDICDRAGLRQIFLQRRPQAVMHLAAETHVDRSIEDAGQFVRTNVVGTHALLEETRRYWNRLEGAEKDAFRFLAVSTDEVYGSLGETGAFTEDSPYNPSSPYAASKAAADHLARAYHRTYGLPVLITNCSNNYGPYQFPEKLIPLMITRALAGQTLPVYGQGANVRDWLYVTDHCRALFAVLRAGVPGRTYNIGANQEKKNIDLVVLLCDLLEQMAPASENPQLAGRSYRDLVTFVTDRPGHDFRYALDASRIASELGWRPSEDFASGLAKTIRWYIDNPRWIERVASGEHRSWIERNYTRRE
jgi:dTDP-glucose 4,6-dehydratase